VQVLQVLVQPCPLGDLQQVGDLQLVAPLPKTTA
jgi:hypothetical protein